MTVHEAKEQAKDATIDRMAGRMQEMGRELLAANKRIEELEAEKVEIGEKVEIMHENQVKIHALVTQLQNKL